MYLNNFGFTCNMGKSSNFFKKYKEMFSVTQYYTTVRCSYSSIIYNIDVNSFKWRQIDACQLYGIRLTEFWKVDITRNLVLTCRLRIRHRNSRYITLDAHEASGLYPKAWLVIDFQASTPCSISLHVAPLPCLPTAEK